MVLMVGRRHQCGDETVRPLQIWLSTFDTIVCSRHRQGQTELLFLSPSLDDVFSIQSLPTQTRHPLSPWLQPPPQPPHPNQQGAEQVDIGRWTWGTDAFSNRTDGEWRQRKQCKNGHSDSLIWPGTARGQRSSPGTKGQVTNRIIQTLVKEEMLGGGVRSVLQFGEENKQKSYLWFLVSVCWFSWWPVCFYTNHPCVSSPCVWSSVYSVNCLRNSLQSERKFKKKWTQNCSIISFKSFSCPSKAIRSSGPLGLFDCLCCLATQEKRHICLFTISDFQSKCSQVRARGQGQRWTRITLNVPLNQHVWVQVTLHHTHVLRDDHQCTGEHHTVHVLVHFTSISYTHLVSMCLRQVYIFLLFLLWFDFQYSIIQMSWIPHVWHWGVLCSCLTGSY